MSDDGLPEPLTPPECDVSMLDGFMLNVKRLFASELLAVGTPEECWAAFLLWCRAWQQVPGGSLPNDEKKLAGFSGAGARWKKVREVALHGFVLCSDGRLYHRFLCQEVRRAYTAHMAYQARRETDKKRLSEWRARHDETPNETRFRTPDETRSVEIETRQDVERKRERGRARGARGSLSQDLVDEWISAAREARAAAGIPATNVKAEWIKYAATKAEPTRAGFIRWAMNARVNGLAENPSDETRDRPTGPPPPLKPHH